MVSALLPLLLSTAYFGNLDRPTSSFFNDDFDLGLYPRQLLVPRYDYMYPLASRDQDIFDIFDIYFRPSGRGISKVQLDKEKFQITLDVRDFKPEEIQVNVTDKYIVIAAKHEEKKDEEGLLARQFLRRFAIPKSVDPDTITSEISSDGVLTISAPVKEIPEEKKHERKVNIVQTGKPAIKEEEKKPEETKTTDGKDASTTSATPSTQENTVTEK